MAKRVNNYPYTNMIYQNIDWLVDAVGDAEHVVEDVEKLKVDVNDLQNQAAEHEQEIGNLTEEAARHSQAITRIDAELAEAKSEIDDITSNQIPRIDTELDKKVNKTDVAHQVYATDEHGENTTLYYNTGVSSDSLVQRTTDGRIRASLPVVLTDVTNKEYVDDAIIAEHTAVEADLAELEEYVDRQDAKREAKWITLVDDVIYTAEESNSKTYYMGDLAPRPTACDELRVYTVIDNGDIEPELYTSTSLDVSVNGGFYFSVDGAVPQASTQRSATEELSMHSWDWSSFDFDTVNYIVLSGEVFSDKSAFQRANVSIASYLDNTTYNYEYDPAEDTPSVDTPGFRGYPIKFVNEYGATVTGTYLTAAYESAPGVQPGQIIVDSFTQGSIAQFGAGTWSYNKVFVEHKIATGTFDMKFINAEMAETETSGSGNRTDINYNYGELIPASNIKHYAMHPADNTINSVTIHLSNGVIREGTRVIIKYKGETMKQTI